MLIFIFSVVVVFFISICFFKKSFWENRYLVLLIVGGVALVATLTINFIVRGHLKTKTIITYSNPICNFYVRDSTIKNDTNFHIVKNLDFLNVEFNKNATSKKDTVHKKKIIDKQIPVHLIFYSKDTIITKEKIYVGYIVNDKRDYEEFNDIYIAPSSSDTLAYITKKKLIYDVASKSNWITGFSLPSIDNIRVLYIPLKEYKLIPDSLIRKIPF